MPGCTVNRTASPQFQELCAQWRRLYPNIDKDLDEAFGNIAQNILANKGWRIATGNPDVEVYKYRQNSSDIRRGQSYGWRIDALFYRPSGVMYPIIVYPKTHWADADVGVVKQGIREILERLGHCTRDGCSGKMLVAEPIERRGNGEEVEVRTKCNVCPAQSWRLALDLGLA